MSQDGKIKIVIKTTNAKHDLLCLTLLFFNRGELFLSKYIDSLFQDLVTSLSIFLKEYYTRRKFLLRGNSFVLRGNFLFWPGIEKVKILYEDAENGREIEGKRNALSIFMFNEMNNGMKKITKQPCKVFSMSSEIVTSRAFLFGVCDNDNQQSPWLLLIWSSLM